MPSQSITTELTFHYLDGRNESFTIHTPIPTKEVANPNAELHASERNSLDFNDFQIQVRHLLGKDWWVVHLPDKTVMINMDTVVKVEINPPLSHREDNDFLADVDPMRALTQQYE